ncbi:FMN-binding protein [Enterococcus columbae DSM 7374 = ATCC 51263]|nr:FMN-binding protein [Enterococcus columbae DSM 7374 = ATCC 51263]
MLVKKVVKGNFAMKMKKILTGFTTLALATVLLAACGSNDKKETKESSAASSKVEESSSEAKAPKKVAGADLQDGTYKLEEKNYEHGYRTVFTIEVKDGKIVKSNYDNVNEKGESKTKDADYNKNMKAKSGTDPETYTPKLNEELVSGQNANVAVVTGATHSSDSFKNYAQQLIQAAQAGKTDTIEIDNGATLKDGTYSLEEKNYAHGYRVTFSIVVKDGKVTESKYDYVNKDGQSKQNDEEYNKNMKAKSGTDPKTYIPQLNEALVKAMSGEEPSVGNVEVITGATHSSDSFKIYAAQLINAAQKGDTAKIEVDNIVTE